MTTNTNNKLTDETLKAWKNEAIISLGETRKDFRDYSHHEAILALVTELQECRKADSAEPDYIRYDCGCCGWETIEDWRENDVCPKCNHKPMGKTELYTAPPAPDNKQTDELVMWVKRLSHSLRNARPDSELHGAAMDYLSRKGLISVEDVLR